ncbi:MAG: DUF3857 domain-containing protein [Candidatus Omnitrophica bacterium]|nr:DUF3857 domain-containing protein [Candidatus Omnitrophota bacterium]MCB9722269.1 DUF3857 domain-containing protein [Candidatus Omnitrophota bacterium]
MWLRLLTILTAVLFCAQPAWSVDQEYSVGPEPGWVTPFAEAGEDSETQDLSKYGISYKVVDDQVRVSGDSRENFSRRRIKVVNQTGVPYVAQFSIDFDPSYQQVTLHHVFIERDGERIDKLPDARIDVLQREKELESMIYNGRKSIHVILNDVRVGDILDYSYTNAGANPIFKGRLFTVLDLQWMVPVHDVRYRIMMPAGRSLNVKVIKAALSPAIETAAEETVYEWRRQDVAAFIPEDRTPPWFLMSPMILVSEMKDWSDVQAWAHELYRIPDPLPESVQEQAAMIRAAHPEKPDQLLAAIRFVQDEVRYTGIEIGPYSYAPNPPQKVLERRFGDCKDKSLLLVSLLGALDIEAHLALVHSGLYTTLPDLLPDPTAFNHAIVRIIYDGKEVWVDPTATLQRGDLEHMWPPDYGYALVIDGRADRLQRMPEQSLPEPELLIQETLDVSGGAEEPGSLVIRNTCQGPAADTMRSSLTVHGPEALLKSFTDVIGQIYPEVEAAGHLEVHDDPKANVMEIIERYTVRQAWVRDDKLEGHTLTIYFPEMSSPLELPNNTKRSMPLGITHPTYIRHTFDITLPDKEWNIAPMDEAIADEAFVLDTKSHFKDGHLFVAYTFRTLAREVPVDRAATHQRNLSRAADWLTYQIYMSEADGSSPFFPAVPLKRWIILAGVAVALLFLAGWGGLLKLTVKYFRHPVRLLKAIVAHPNIPPLFFVLVWANGASHLVEKIAYEYSATQPHLQQWAVIGIIAGLFGLPLGFIRYYLGGGIIHIGQKIVGGKGDYRAARRIYLYSGFPMDLAELGMAVVIGILLGNEHLVSQETTVFEALRILVVIIMVFVVIVVIYKAIRHVLKASAAGARFVFIVLPILLFLSLAGFGFMQAMREDQRSTQQEAAGWQAEATADLPEDGESDDNIWMEQTRDEGLSQRIREFQATGIEKVEIRFDQALTIARTYREQGNAAEAQKWYLEALLNVSSGSDAQRDIQAEMKALDAEAANPGINFLIPSQENL